MEDGNYLAASTENDGYYETLNEEQLSEMQAQLWALLVIRTRKYTMGDSTSVPIETAEELLNSINYCLSLGRRTSTETTALSLNTSIDLEEQFSGGLSVLSRQMKIAKLLTSQANSSMLEFENVYYEGALAQVASFFKVYDFRFFAHKNHVDFDYHLCHSVEEKRGIERINLYLSNLKIENNFCECFSIDTAKALLNAYATDFFEQYVNIYELIANNALALVALKMDVFTLDVSPASGERLAKQLLALPKEQAAEMMVSAAAELCALLDINGKSAGEYHRKTALKLCQTIEAFRDATDFFGIFYSIYSNDETTAETTNYIDSESMDNDILMELIDKISDCKKFEDKIALVNKEVKSLSDLVEVLNISFWGDECIPLFKSFGVEAISILVHFVYKQNENHDGWRSESRWEDILDTYVAKMDANEKQKVSDIVEMLNQSSEVKNPLEKLTFEQYEINRNAHHEN